MDRRQKALFKRISSVFVPLLILLVISLAGTGVYFAYRMLHPARRSVINTPEGYQQILKKPAWDERTWNGADGEKISGWLLYHDYTAPVIIVSHGYGSNREELLSTAYRLWDTGYHVLTYDLRAHGNSQTEKSSLGPKELEDLKATIAFAKGLKTNSGQPLTDERIGLYGVELGGAISIAAAADEPAVRAVAADSVYASQDAYRQYLTKTIIGDSGPPGSSTVEGSIFQSVLAVPLSVMGAGGAEPPPVEQSISKLGDKPVLLIVSKTSRLSPFAKQTAAMVQKAPGAQVIEFDRTRADTMLIKDDAKAYDDAVVSFFSQVPGFGPPAAQRKEEVAQSR